MSFLLSWAGLSVLAPIAGWLGLGGGVVVAALALAWFFPPLRRLALTVALVAAVATTVYARGVHDGSAFVKASWDAAEQRAIEQGGDARQEAEREIAADPPPVSAPVAAPERGAPRRVRNNDPYNRDND